MDRLTEKTIIVTGGTSGIGLAAVHAFVAAGAFVLGVGRSQQRNQKAKQEILMDFPEGKLYYLLADLASQAQVRTLAKNISSLLAQNGIEKVDVLVNNAGMYMERKHRTEDGIEATFAVNHLAPFLLTHELLPLLMHADDGRVLIVSSYSHFTTPLNLNRIADPWPYFGLLAYKRSKLCNVLFTHEINRRYQNVTAFAVDPGLVNTPIASKGDRGISHWVWRNRRKKGTSPEVPVRTLLFLAGKEEIDRSKGIYYKDSAPKQPSKKSENARLAAALWDLSCRLTGILW